MALCIIDHYAVVEDNDETAIDKDNKVELPSLWTPVLEYYSTYTLDHLKPIIKNLIDYMLIAPTSKTNNVYKKYSSSKLIEAAKITEKSEPFLREILQSIFKN